MIAGRKNQQQHNHTDKRIAQKAGHGGVIAARMDNQCADQKNRQRNIGQSGNTLHPKMLRAFFGGAEPAGPR